MLALPKASKRRRTAWASLGVIIALVVLAVATRDPLLQSIGAALVTEDLLTRSTAIVPLSGGTPFREMEAARLYREGLAERVIVVPDAYDEKDKAFAQLGIDVVSDTELRQQVLVRLGVPPEAIVLTAGRAYGTVEELRAVLDAIPPQTEGPVILVTSSYHTRRTGILWDALTGGQRQGVVRVARQDPVDPHQWWHDRRAALAVTHEYLSLLNFWLGLPVRGAN